MRQLLAIGFAIAMSGSVATGAEGAVDPPLRILSAGDSYAAGEGLPGVQTGEGECQRALGLESEGNTAPSKAWPVLLKESFERAPVPRHWDVDPFWFVACTGNTTDNFTRTATQRGGELAQLGEAQRGAGDEPWDVVTLSFGGNDIGFSEILADCIGLETTLDDLSSPESILLGGSIPALLNGSFAGCSMTEGQMKAQIERTLPQALDKLYGEVAAVSRRGAAIIVTGYPHLVAEPSVWPIKDRLLNRCNRISEGDARALRGATGFLNQTIGAAVDRASKAHPSHNWVWVDVNRWFEPGGPAESHALCGPDEWLNGFSFGGITDGDMRGFDPGSVLATLQRAFNRSFHPNQEGHDGYAFTAASALTRSGWTPQRVRGGVGLGEDELARVLGCVAPCRVTGAFAFQHPTWQSAMMVTTDEATTCGSATAAVVDESLRIVFSERFECMEYVRPASTPVDGSGRLFLDFNPGRYNGVIVLQPTTAGFEDYGSLPPSGDYAGRFYYADQIDHDHDGVLEIDQHANDCQPTCADAQTTTVPYRWSDGDFRPDPTFIDPASKSWFEAFLAAWWEGASNDRLRAWATADALAQLTDRPDGWAYYELDWSDSCLMGSSGAGGCHFTLVSDQGGGFTWFMSYHGTDSEGSTVIDAFEPVGGGE